MEIIDLQPALKQMIENHGYQASIIDDYILPNFNEEVKLTTRVDFNNIDSDVSSRLDIGINFNDGRTLYEAFGDFGETESEALSKNFENFAKSSFHVILSSLNDLDDEQITREVWSINNQPWDIYIGNITGKSTMETPPSPPLETINVIQSYIENLNLNSDYHWVRFFFADVAGERTFEFMVDNIEQPEIVEKLKNLNWGASNGKFYSHRNFIVLKKKHNSIKTTLDRKVEGNSIRKPWYKFW